MEGTEDVLGEVCGDAETSAISREDDIRKDAGSGATPQDKNTFKNTENGEIGDTPPDRKIGGAAPTYKSNAATAGDRDSGASTPESEGSGGVTDAVVKANSRGDGQNLKIDKIASAAVAAAAAAAELEAGKKGVLAESLKAGRGSNSDDEIPRRKLEMNTIPLKKVSQSDIHVLREEGGGGGGGHQAQVEDESFVEKEEEEYVTPPSSSSPAPSTPSPTPPTTTTTTTPAKTEEKNDLSRSFSSSNSLGNKDGRLDVHFHEPSSSFSSSSSSPPKSPVLSDEEYEEYLPEAVSESALIFGVSQSASPVSSVESLVVSPTVETASFPPREMVKKLPCGCVRESVKAVWNRNDDRRFGEKISQRENDFSQLVSDFSKREKNLIGNSVEKLVSLQSFGHRNSRGIIEEVEHGPEEEASLLTRTSSSVTIRSSDDLDFDEEMQIRELLALQEGVVSAEAALSALEDEEEEENGKERFSLCDAWGRCLSCFKTAH